MKRFILIISVALLASINVAGQNSVKTVSNHSVSVNLFGADYAYEQSLGGNWSILGRIGFEPIKVEGYIDEHDVTHSQFSPRPALTIEPRFYFNLGRRARQGRATDLNAADFLSIKASTAKLSSGHRDDTAFYVAAQYGIRRVWDRLFIEPTIGVAYHAWFDDWLPELQFRIGYAF